MQICFFERGIQLFQLVNISTVQESCENSGELVFGFQELNCDWLINIVPCLLFGWREATTGKMSFCRLEKLNTRTNFIWSPDYQIDYVNIDLRHQYGILGSKLLMSPLWNVPSSKQRCLYLQATVPQTFILSV